MSSETIPRIPPHDRDAERSVLGSALRDNATILDVAGILQPEDFYVFAHQVVWKAMTQTYLDAGSVDPVTLADKIKGLDAIEDAGGCAYLLDLAQSESAANIEHHARIVRSFALRRSLIHLGREMEDGADDRQMPPEHTLETIEGKLFEMADQGRKSQAESVKVAVQQAAKRIEARKNKTATEGIPTGWHDLDELLGFLEDGSLVIVAARPGIGKTAFAINLGWNVAKRGEHVFLTSLEQPKIEIGERLIAMQGEINSYTLRTGKVQSMYAVDGAVSKISELPITIDDAPNQGILNIAATTRRSKVHSKTKLVIIDYLQLIQPESGVINRQEQVAGISRRLKLLARELKTPVVCLAQVNRSSEARADGRIRMSDLRESGAIEQDADVVLLLQKEPKKEGTSTPVIEQLEVEIGKNRNGPIGSVLLGFWKQTQRIENYASGGGF